MTQRHNENKYVHLFKMHIFIFITWQQALEYVLFLCFFFTLFYFIFLFFCKTEKLL